MTPVSVTLPVFVTVNVYGTTCAGSRDRGRRRRLHHLQRRLWLTGMFNVSVSGADSAESAVTVFDRLPPASTSACVTVWVQV